MGKTTGEHRLAHLSLGSNLSERERHIKEALRQLERLGCVGTVSSLYETEPVEYIQQPWFLNCAAELETGLEPLDLLAGILEIEKSQGRMRSDSPPKGPRIIDIDILLLADTILKSPDLTIPHPAMQYRRFVLEPLAEIAPDVRHPLLRLTVREMLEALAPGPSVRRYGSQEL